MKNSHLVLGLTALAASTNCVDNYPEIFNKEERAGAENLAKDGEEASREAQVDRVLNESERFLAQINMVLECRKERDAAMAKYAEWHAIGQKCIRKLAPLAQVANGCADEVEKLRRERKQYDQFFAKFGTAMGTCLPKENTEKRMKCMMDHIGSQLRKMMGSRGQKGNKPKGRSL